ncbi:MAG: ribonuclease J [Sulfobacillus sp.]
MPKKDRLRVIALGGLGEIGKNMMVYEYDDEIVVIDAGLAFPDDDMFGIDYVIPDISYLVENKDKVRGIFLTHGHEDHIGALPYVLQQLDVPIFTGRLTLGMIKRKLQEHGLAPNKDSREINPGELIRFKHLALVAFRVNHSIPDAVGFLIDTPVGRIVHTGDFKFDQTPVDGQVADFFRLTEIGQKGVLALFADSTNAERPGFTGSEKAVGGVLEDVIRAATGRVFVASFASNVHRIQQVISVAAKLGRKVAILGRSMENVVSVAIELGYLQVPEATIIPIDEVSRFTPAQLVILTTGSQGEPMAALSRMASAEHKRIEIVTGDTVIIAATPIPGNERLVGKTINNLYKRGATVVNSAMAGVHVSGHASQEELKLMHTFIRPKFFIPVHGEYRHLIRHRQLAEAMGMPRENILIGDNGSVFEFTKDSAEISGRVQAGPVFIDGLGVGDVGHIVLRDRKLLAEDGVIVVVLAIDRSSNQLIGGPDIVSRGFVYVRESDALLDEAKQRIRDSIEQADSQVVGDWSNLKGLVRETLGRFLYEKTRRRPMILPIVVEA